MKKLLRKKIRTKKPKPLNHRGVIFPEVRGRTVELVELFTDSDFPCVSIRFQDATDLTVVIDPALTFSASFSKWKDGNECVLKRWPLVRSE